MKDINKIMQKISPFYKDKEGPAIEHKLVYDSSSETLEPVYFWILDFMGKMFKNVDKISDNFASSPGSGHFSELGTKKSQMQQEAGRILGTVNNVLKGTMNVIYDLKEFKIRLSHYETARDSNKETANAGLLSLKQIWMDKVDVLRGQGSINALTAGDLNFVTLRDAFLATDSVNAVNKIDLNDRVKRILKPRLQEFFEWRKQSEQELRKRYEIEKRYLKSEVESLRLYSRWAKPYLQSAERLEEDEDLRKDAALVTAFNTVLLQLSIMGYNEINVQKEALSRNLPEGFVKLDEKKKIRKYFSILVVDFNFRGIPGKAGQHYVFGGRASLNFKSYALNEEELDLLKHELNKSDLEDSLKLVTGMTDDSLGKISDDIHEFLDEENKEIKITKQDTNPFTALFNFKGLKFKKAPTEEEEKEKKLKKLLALEEKGVKKDIYAEQYIRSLAEASAMDTGFTVYDTYKKSMGMGSVRVGGEKGEARGGVQLPKSKAERLFGMR